MDPLTMAMLGGSLLSGVGGMIGAGRQSGAATSAANQSAIWQILGQQQGRDAAMQMYNKAATTLDPYTTAGGNSLKLLTSYLQGDAAKQAGIGGGGANLLSTFEPTMEQLEKTPGYQFTLSQGTKAAQNAAAAKGLGASGNAIQGGINYATGLASTTFNEQLKNYMSQNLQAYNMLMGPSQIGVGAATTLAGGAMNLGGQMMNNLQNAYMNVGNTIGAGTMGAANAESQGIQSLASSAGQAAMMPYYAQNFARNVNPSATASAGGGSLFDWFGGSTGNRQLSAMNYGPQQA
jgi:hypothetical protein